MSGLRRKWATRWAMSLVVLFFCGSLRAGGGPENVFLVVNSAVPHSMTIANHFIEWRDIPAGSVFYIDWPDPPFDIDSHEFRDRILGPTLKEIERRQLSKQIDYIVYSSGFPYRVNFTPELKDSVSDHPWASITSLTYLYEYTMQENIRELILERKNAQRPAIYANAYARDLVEGGSIRRSRGFRARYGIDMLGNRVKKGSGGKHYYLSTMLGHTRGVQNNTLLEVMKYLRNGDKADGSKPEGTIYLVSNANVRSSVRHDNFESVAAELENLGVNAEVIEGQGGEKLSLPVDKDDVQGAVVGYFKTSWGLTNSKILPGAIVENFTSYGGVLSGASAKSQSLLCDFLKFGAVASSGTVAEPFAIAAKFPHPGIHVHYARGCSVAEAYYQSVICPYQLIIVGDPLCQPWAVPPTVELAGLNPQETVSGVLELQASAKSSAGHKIRNLDVFVDGVLVARTLPDQPIQLDTNRFSNGYHELRVVAIEDTPIETQGRTITGFVSANLPAAAEDSGDAKPQIGVSAEFFPRGGIFRLGQPAIVKVRSPGAREIRIYRGRNMLGRTAGGSGRIVFDVAKLGGGPATLRAVAFPSDLSLKPVFGFPLKANVEYSPN